jgi:hypothetical protein
VDYSGFVSGLSSTRITHGHGQLRPHLVAIGVRSAVLLQRFREHDRKASCPIQAGFSLGFQAALQTATRRGGLPVLDDNRRDWVEPSTDIGLMLLCQPQLNGTDNFGRGEDCSHRYLGSLQLFASEKTAGLRSLPQIFPPARRGC